MSFISELKGYLLYMVDSQQQPDAAFYYGARAFVNFYYTGTAVEQRNSAGVQSVVRVSTGVYNLTFDRRMPSIHYAVTGTACAVNGNVLIVAENSGATPGTFVQKDTSSVQIRITNNAGTLTDPNVSCSVAIHAITG